MNTISQTDALLQDASNEVSRFLHQYKVSDILKQCNAYKQKGYSVIQLFAFFVTLMFQPMSTYMAMYLLSVEINLLQKKNGKILKKLPAKLVYVRNKANKKDWIAIISTNTELSEEEIIRRYGYRWNIEVYFKTCKQYLKYTKECQSPSFDSLTAHLAIANVRYMMLSILQRENTDDRSLAELFWLYAQEVAEITFEHSMQLVMIALLSTFKEFISLSEEQMAAFAQAFVEKLPNYLKQPLMACVEQVLSAG